MNKAIAHFDTVCPSRYQRVDESLIKCKSIFREVLNYPYSNDLPPGDEWCPGILLHGESGSGKTRTAFARLQKLCSKNRHEFFYFSPALSWATKASTEAKNGNLDEWLELFTRMNHDGDYTTVFLDDLDKVKWTACRQQALLHVIETRTSNDLDIIITTQITAEQLLAKMIADSKPSKGRKGDDENENEDELGSEATAQSIVRRLCDPTVFKAFKFEIED